MSARSTTSRIFVMLARVSCTAPYARACARVVQLLALLPGSSGTKMSSYCTTPVSYTRYIAWVASTRRTDRYLDQTDHDLDHPDPNLPL